MAEEGSSDYKKLRKRWFYKEPLIELYFVEPKMLVSLFFSPLFLKGSSDAHFAQVDMIL